MIADHEKYMVATYARPLPVFTKGSGSYLWDLENRRYIDFTAGIAVNALGHGNPELCELIYEQVCVSFFTFFSLRTTNPRTGKTSHAHIQPLP